VLPLDQQPLLSFSHVWGEEYKTRTRSEMASRIEEEHFGLEYL
jgi:hypothetical protein